MTIQERLAQHRAYLAGEPRDQTHGQTLLVARDLVALVDALAERLALVLLKLDGRLEQLDQEEAEEAQQITGSTEPRQEDRA